MGLLVREINCIKLAHVESFKIFEAETINNSEHKGLSKGATRATAAYRVLQSVAHKQLLYLCIE